ncbi:MAG: hypothetical protein ABW202_17510 [Duganella sp.]
MKSHIVKLIFRQVKNRAAKRPQLAQGKLISIKKVGESDVFAQQTVPVC